MTPTPNTQRRSRDMWCIQLIAPTASDESRDRADRRPWARVDEMVVVMGLGVGVGHRPRLRL